MDTLNEKIQKYEDQIAELNKEKKKIEEQLAQAQEERKKYKMIVADEFREKLDTMTAKEFLLATIKHNRRSCSDSNSNNAFYRDGTVDCPKCALMEYLNGYITAELSVDIHFDILRR